LLLVFDLVAKMHCTTAKKEDASMFYMLQIFLVVSIPIFVLAGAVLLSMIVWTEIMRFLSARAVSRRRKTAIITPTINRLAFHKPR
jgi:hypothetical protein